MKNLNKESIIKLLENDRFASTNKITLVKAKAGNAIAKMEITDNHLNGLNIVQGGAIFTLADFAFAAASNMKGKVTVSVSANISFFKIPFGSMLTAIATEVSCDKKLCSYNVDVTDMNHELVAKVYVTAYMKYR